jgi:hypothetical protein
LFVYYLEDKDLDEIKLVLANGELFTLVYDVTSMMQEKRKRD